MLAGKADQILIGLMCRKTEASECEKYWLDGSEVSYENWKEGEPSSSRGNKDCTTITDGGEWISVDCREEHLFACVIRGSSCLQQSVN
ncbi:unnamed protein product [Cylicocyclus nassatus]|uniref:C-type lectin domain-containing protein n=1 Tax=Cylicocyclus nassatus TaxID=53992 RepID=A0AA36M4Y3_CYLNA|nr:unnamed protein product [Cylicocyclus nassatus]